MEIKVRYFAVDGYTESRTFKTVVGASRYARRQIGDHPEIGSRYAVSDDGIGKIEVSGASLSELFPKPRDVVFGCDERQAVVHVDDPNTLRLIDKVVNFIPPKR